MSERLRRIYVEKEKRGLSGPDDSRRRAAEIDAVEKAERFVALRGMRNADLEPSERIRRWESIYGMRLPTNSGHSVVRLIAQATGLTIDAILAEQARRSSRASL